MIELAQTCQESGARSTLRRSSYPAALDLILTAAAEVLSEAASRR
ncbi:hypothetical protein [Streptomyces sp. NPDC047706]